VLQQFITAVQEILAEMGAEVVAEPMRLVAEVAQFAILLAIVWVVAVGFGKRRGFVANMLAERADRIHHELELASHADADLAEAQATARMRLSEAQAECDGLLAAARADAEKLEADSRAQTDTEVARIAERTDSALATENDEMRLELREELVSVVAQATRSILNEKMTVTEQRDLIEDSIMHSLDAASAPEATVGTGASPTAAGHRVGRRSTAAPQGA
jgi:F-type H+-transporting ATPase subunit b